MTPEIRKLEEGLRKAMTYMLTIEQNRVYIRRADRDAFPYIVQNMDDLRDYLATEAKRLGVKVEALDVFASSTMDFPEEWTTEPATIALARELRK